MARRRGERAGHEPLSGPIRVDFAGLLLGSRKRASRRIGVFEGIPAMGLDALASIAYGPEAALLVLAPLGVGAPMHARWLMLPVLVLLALLYVTYRQTIGAYPGNGGAYVVARDNLGEAASLLAAGALMIDYVLNAAVGISAGVGALISILPSLQPYTSPLCLVVLAVLTLINLRGAMFSGRVLALPAYAYIGCFLAVIAWGLYRAAVEGGHPHTLIAPYSDGNGSEPANAWLLLQAFAVACSATTGVEAVSNSVSAFRDPVRRHGRHTLGLIVAALMVLLAGVAWLLPVYGIHAMDQSQPGYRSVLAQLVAAVSGHGAFFFLVIAVLLCVLMLSANTSFVAMPRLCRSIADDGYLPRRFSARGNHFGMLFLAGGAALLLIGFGGITQKLVPLFTIGVLLGFTLSQLSLTLHWERALREGHWGTPLGLWLRLLINALGALVTMVAIVVVLVSQFTEGAWIALFAVPASIVLLKFVQRRRAER
ncbi:MAG TPA: APC family permease [Rhodanobacteraceae bacterium]